MYCSCFKITHGESPHNSPATSNSQAVDIGQHTPFAVFSRMPACHCKILLEVFGSRLSQNSTPEAKPLLPLRLPTHTLVACVSLRTAVPQILRSSVLNYMTLRCGPSVISDNLTFLEIAHRSSNAAHHYSCSVRALFPAVLCFIRFLRQDHQDRSHHAVYYFAKSLPINLICSDTTTVRSSSFSEHSAFPKRWD